MKRGGERGFGLVFAAVFALIALWPLVGGTGIRVWALAIAIGFGAVALIVPRWLALPNTLWFKLGLLLGAIVAPVVMLLVYVTTVVPIGLWQKARGRDLLHGRFDASKESYWTAREKPPQPLDRQY